MIVDQNGCPVGQNSNGVCPVSGAGARAGVRGCAFSGFSMDAQSVLYGAPQGPHTVKILRQREEKTMIDLLMVSETATKDLENADSLNPTPSQVLAMALGAPARRVLTRADEMGPLTGWRDGYLSSNYGFCPPEPNASPMALALSAGRVWSDICERMPGIVARGKIRETILQMPLVSGERDVIPDDALMAAVTCLGILASVYRYEGRNDGREGIAAEVNASAFLNATGDAEDEEPETKGVPRNVAIPLRTICKRVGRPLPHLTQFDLSLYNYKIRDPTNIDPYVARRENMDVRWPVFGDYAEATFLLCMAEVHGVFVQGPELIARCQEKVMERDNEGLKRDLAELKEMIDQLGPAFHKISMNSRSGENFSNPVQWGQRFAKFSAPLSGRVPALSGLALPLFHLMDAFLGRSSYATFLGVEALHLRGWFPLNIRAFIAAVETEYKVPDYIISTGDPTLIGLLDGLVESYAGERGFMGTHRYKVYGFLEVVAKTGRVETNGGSGSGDTQGRPWEEVHNSLSDSMIERLQPFRRTITKKPNELRGCFAECRAAAKILGRESIDNDPDRTTAKITIGLEGTGITFAPGDRLAIMPKNSTKDVTKMLLSLDLEERYSEEVPLDKSPEWTALARHMASVGRPWREEKKPWLTVRDILTCGHLAPLTREIVHSIHLLLRASSSTVLKVLASETWPVHGSIGDLLRIAVTEVPQDTWNKAFNQDDLSWLVQLVPVEVPRTYSIASYSADPMPKSVDLTISRAEHEISPLLRIESDPETKRAGVASGFLNPHPSQEKKGMKQDKVLIGVSRPINFQLPVSPSVSIGMFCGGSGIAPFRSFWASRIQHARHGRNILFLGVQSRSKFLYEEELVAHVRNGNLELHTAFSRDKNGLVYDSATRQLRNKIIEPRYLDATIVENARTVCDLIMSTKQGGCGGYIYICGSVSLYETVMTGIRRAIYVSCASSEKLPEILLATAFAERRMMLDIFMTPRPLSFDEPPIPMTELALHTGHREGSRMWIGVHGIVYDITDFLPTHPGGTLIVAASAGLDASRTFDDLAHTNNPEVSTLLPKYAIGRMAPKPKFHEERLDACYADWSRYLSLCVESLTTLSLEVQSILSDSDVWSQGDLLNMGGIRKFYQFQSRFLQNGFGTLFGPRLQELCLKLSFTVSTSGSLDESIPDVMGMTSRAKTSKAAVAVQKQIASIGAFVCDGAGAQAFENGILSYAREVVEQDLRFLELIREYVCTGMSAFDLVQQSVISDPRVEKLATNKLSRFLLSVLEKAAQRLQGFYDGLAALSLFNPRIERNPARARWQLVGRYIRDGSFFVYTGSDKPDFSSSSSTTTHRRRSGSERISFTDVVANINDMIRLRQRDVISAGGDPSTPVRPTLMPGPRNLALQQMDRASPTSPFVSTSTSSFFETLDADALHQINAFIHGNLNSIRNLSRVPPSLDTLDELDKLSRQLNHEDGDGEPSEPGQNGAPPTPPQRNSATLSPNPSIDSREGRPRQLVRPYSRSRDPSPNPAYYKLTVPT
ncbi:MAG: hypothetical protein M1839_005396 [Geoglossum umbratile]|nr:MAG: hypothetical protein M1839_005396 [Geoglossum umbratile]